MPNFTADKLVPPDQIDLKTIRPFKKGEFSKSRSSKGAVSTGSLEK